MDCLETLDSTDSSNYRPIANVTFLSKILECIIANQLLVHVDVNGLFPPLQSGFQRNHSTETFIVGSSSIWLWRNGLWTDNSVGSFDVSAAFDSVDHSILLNRLSVSFGLIGKPLEWLRSFLTDRTHCVVVGSSRSCWVPVLFGVPQGSVLGPLLYILRILAPWSDHVASCTSCMLLTYRHTFIVTLLMRSLQSG